MDRLENILGFCVSQRDSITRTLSLLGLPEKDPTRTMLEARVDAYSYVVNLVLFHLDSGMELPEMEQGVRADLVNEHRRVGSFCSLGTEAILANMSAYEYFSSMESIYLDIIDELESKS